MLGGARPARRPGQHPDRPARPPRRAPDRDRDRRRLAGALRDRDPQPPAHRDRRAPGAVQGRPEGLVGDAPQAQPDPVRADRRARPAAARLRAHRARGPAALARARHQPLERRAGHPARRDDPARLHARPDDRAGRRPARPLRADAREHRARPRPARLVAACWSRWSTRAACRARTPTRSSSARRCARPTSARRCATSSRSTRPWPQRLSLARLDACFDDARVPAPRARGHRPARRALGAAGRSGRPTVEGDGRCSLSRSCAPARSATCTRSTTAGSLLVASDRISRVRRRPADDDPRQGPRADRPVAVLVRRDGRHRRRTTCSARTSPSCGSTGDGRGPASRRRPGPLLRGRIMICRPADVLPIEVIVRGYLAGSGWKDYRATGAVCGIALPAGLRESDRLPEPIFTPSTKAEPGDHDENINFDAMVEPSSAGCSATERRPAADAIRAIAALYGYAAAVAPSGAGSSWPTRSSSSGHRARRRATATSCLILIDEVLTPDSSRFWDAATLRARPAAGELRQAVRARLARGPALGQDGARAGAAGRRRRRAPGRATSRPTSGSPARASSATSRRT